jgi:CHAD domain-containing protein
MSETVSKEASTKGKDKPGNKSGGTIGQEVRSAPLWIASRTLLAEHRDEFFSRWEKTARKFQEDDVHDLRVASRRLREGLALFSPCFPPKRTAALVKEIKKVTTMLGDLRNTDEAFLFFSSLSAEETAHSLDEVKKLLTALKSERDQAHKKLRKELSSLDPEPLRTDLEAVQNRSNLFRDSAVDPFMSIIFFAGGAIMDRAETLGELLPRAVQENDSAAQHQLRIAVKKMRYRLELIEPLFSSDDYQELHGALKGYQDVLGKLHDIDVFSGMVQERIDDGAGREGLLRAMAQRRSRLHGSFMQMLDSFPLGSIGERTRDAL